MYSSISIFIALTALFSLVRADETPMIIGGTNAKRHDFPYFVEMGGCGGALISENTVLFAAHCGDWLWKQVVVNSYKPNVADNGSFVRHCVEWKRSDDYNPSSLDNDFALCKLDQPVDLSDHRVKLEVNFNDAPLENGEELIAVGLGKIADEVGAGGPKKLQKVTVPYIDNDMCNSEQMYRGRVTDSMLCAGYAAGGLDSCQGDSGGPLIRRKKVGNNKFIDSHVGVVSWGSGCAKENKPGVYARTTEAKEFLKDTVCKEWNDGSASFCDNVSTQSANDEKVKNNEVEIEIQIKTDEYPHETQFWLDRKKKTHYEVLQTRKYYLPYYKNIHIFKIRKNACYRFEIADEHGDALTFGKRGKFAIGLKGERPYYQSNANFGHGHLEKFCINGDGEMVAKLNKKKKNN